MLIYYPKIYAFFTIFVFSIHFTCCDFKFFDSVEYHGKGKILSIKSKSDNIEVYGAVNKAFHEKNESKCDEAEADGETAEGGGFFGDGLQSGECVLFEYKSTSVKSTFSKNGIIKKNQYGVELSVDSLGQSSFESCELRYYDQNLRVDVSDRTGSIHFNQIDEVGNQTEIEVAIPEGFNCKHISKYENFIYFFGSIPEGESLNKPSNNVDEFLFDSEDYNEFVFRIDTNLILDNNFEINFSCPIDPQECDFYYFEIAGNAGYLAGVGSLTSIAGSSPDETVIVKTNLDGKFDKIFAQFYLHTIKLTD